MVRSLSILLFFCFFASCDPYHFAQGHVIRVTERAGLQLHKLNLEGCTISYWDSGIDGNKPVLLLIHGLGAEAEFHWYKQLPSLNRYRVIMPNLLYFAESRPDKDNFSAAEQVRAMEELINVLDLKEFYLCGFSYGGLVAAELARKEPGKIKKLVLMDAPVKFFGREDIQPLLKEFGLSEPADLLVPSSGKAMKDLSSVIYAHPPMIPMAFHKSFQENVYGKNAKQYRSILRALEKDKMIYENKEYLFKFPVLLIWGEHDRMVPKEVGKALEDYIGESARLVVIPGTAHVPNLERPLTYNRILKKFLAEPLQSKGKELTTGR